MPKAERQIGAAGSAAEKWDIRFISRAAFCARNLQREGKERDVYATDKSQPQTQRHVVRSAANTSTGTRLVKDKTMWRLYGVPACYDCPAKVTAET